MTDAVSRFVNLLQGHPVRMEVVPSDGFQVQMELFEEPLLECHIILRERPACEAQDIKVCCGHDTGAAFVELREARRHDKKARIRLGACPNGHGPTPRDEARRDQK